ncbi:gamma-glutamylcyclotransferase family protein [Naasia lichenicola]|uniref:Gamma-glutamylcyclotransferase n=1 Tax=Naasia lichenicola TaxID=2565933 RepID=A0A4V3WTE8_9MICO|nr:gamma-glutamylcyclotransferase family protein [Naasia lichenicola]THG31677.1 gamma-glutamylcyclotransferase [Naasia lichenicola]
MTSPIFSFGTLQLAAVQTSLFGRAVPTTPDSLAGWTVGEITILDPEVIAMSGTDRHPALLPGSPDDVVPGAILDVTDDELAAADHYERVSYERISVTLQSGRDAWVYVPRSAPLGG